jgi:hypothetical protein
MPDGLALTDVLRPRLSAEIGVVVWECEECCAVLRGYKAAGAA